MTKDRFDIHQHITDKMVEHDRAGRGRLPAALASRYRQHHAARQHRLEEGLSRR